MDGARRLATKVAFPSVVMQFARERTIERDYGGTVSIIERVKFHRHWTNKYLAMSPTHNSNSSPGTGTK
jgi:hypothetical protein